MSIRVLLAEDHTIVREGLRSLLEGAPDLEVVGEVSNGREAIEVCAQLVPTVVVMDVGMPVLNGIDATREIKQRFKNVGVLTLSMYSEEEYVRAAIRAGVDGYLVKGSGLSDLVAAIRAVARGEAFFSPAVAKILVKRGGEDKAKTGPEAQLTPREREVLVMVAEGKSSPEIAEILGLSVKTVEGHRSRILAKLGAGNVAGLVRYAIKHGLISA